MLQKIPRYFCLCLSIFFSMEVAAACTPWTAKIAAMQGRVMVQSSGSAQWSAAKLYDTFCPGDKVRTLQHSRATLELRNESLVTLDQKTTLIFKDEEKKTLSWLLELINGSAFFRSRQPHRLEIRTPFVNAVHEGTEFLVSVNESQTDISVFDGQVTAVNQLGSVQVEQGFMASTLKGQAPQVRPLKIKPEDAVQWTLYFPPVIDYSMKASVPGATDIQQAANLARQGLYFQALEVLNKAPEVTQDSAFNTFKASLLLSAGAVAETLTIIEQTLNKDPNNTEAISLLAIVEVTKNNKQQAMELAKKAVSSNPKSAVAKIALSYALQATFAIKPALKSVQEATQLAPDNALAWSRLAELQLSTGDRKSALASAEKAKVLNPELGKTHTILGFTHLAQVDIDEAKQDFTRAIALDSADPLPRLGLGLAKIRKGQKEAGTRDIETAATLDPNNALVRSYLGKAYYELRNESYARKELALAKEMDPKDPTPWFYDAILKQSANRPVEALQDMQKAIELNDNRAVHRSKLLLDEDNAARTANLSRIYDDLDFNRLALKQSWKSLAYDATNYSAHQNLADSYARQPRHRIARASELLQAQLLQPINLRPVQPQLSSENVGVLNSSGPASLSTHEYDPMFTSNGVHVLFNGAIGGNDTRTNNAVLSGVYDNFSFSLGQHNYRTDGFRVNDDYAQNVYNLFAQMALTPDLNIQVEFKREDVTTGDVPLNFNGFHQEDRRQTIDQDTARFGLHYQIDQQQDLILSTFFTRKKEIITNQRVAPPIISPLILPSSRLEITNTTHTKSTIEESGYQLEGQYLFHPQSFELVAGFGFLNLDGKSSTTTRKDSLLETFSPLFPLLEELSPPEFKPGNPKTTPSHKETNYFNGYIYSTIELTTGLTSVLGVSFDSYNDGLTDRNQFNPKVGLTWNPISELTLRGAVFRTLKRPLAASQTIEPTQIAGFNQFFDGNNGTTAWHYGFGLDYQPINNVYIGGEVTWRDTTHPVVSDSVAKPQGRDEVAHLAYLYWAAFDWAAFSAEYRFDEYRRDYTANAVSPNNPRSVATHQVPLSLNLYHSSGLFSKFTGTFVNQGVEYVNNRNGLDKDSDRFWLFDAAIGFRLPKRVGSISFEVRNLFNNKNFRYNSVFDASGPQLSPFVPERELFLKLNLAY